MIWSVSLLERCLGSPKLNFLTCIWAFFCLYFDKCRRTGHRAKSEDWTLQRAHGHPYVEHLLHRLSDSVPNYFYFFFIFHSNTPLPPGFTAQGSNYQTACTLSCVQSAGAKRHRFHSLPYSEVPGLAAYSEAQPAVHSFHRAV